MRKITVAITAAALAVSMLASAIPAAAAVAGYDSAYAGESAFVNLSPGQSNMFQVFFANTGTTTWTKGTATQVDLAACLDDKTTCNAQDATEAGWNTGWLSATRYATTTQASVAPGSIGTFSYTVTAPTGAAAGTYRFNGALVLSSSGADIHNEGYYQDATVGANGAASITSLTPNAGSTAGGTSVTVAGSGFTCTPAFPTVAFGTNNGAVTSCGASTLTVTSPASTTGLGAVTVTVTNSGAAASNGLTFTYQDTTKPSYTSLAQQGNVATVTFSEPVCRAAAFAPTDWTATVNGTPNTVTGDLAPSCDTLTPHANGVTSFNVFLTSPVPTGSFVALTLNATTGSINANIVDASNNASNAPRSNTATTSAPPTTAPVISSASGNGGSTALTVTFSKPVYCSSAATGGTDFSVTTGTTTIAGASSNCPTTPQTAVSSYTITLASNLASNTTYTLNYSATPAGTIKDVYNNSLAAGSSTTFTSGAQDVTPPTATSTKIVTNTGSTNWGDVGDEFTITFSEKMAAPLATSSITLQDGDGSSMTLTCDGTNTSCTLDSTKTVLDVKILVAQAGSGGTTPGLQIPATIVASNQITDLAGNVPNWPGSADRTLDYQ